MTQKSSEPTRTFETGSHREEILNIATHGIGVLAGIVALMLLVNQGLNSGSMLTLMALVIYGLSLLWTYLCSTLYHSAYQADVKLRNKLHLLDHTAIYLFIAGTYTPICLFVLPPGWRLGILGGVWALAVAGILFKIFLIGRFKKLSLIIYLLMGWLILLAADPLAEHASDNLLFYILLGGASYTLGTIFFSLRKLPFNHAIWHLFVLGGSISHFIGIYLYL